MKPAIINGKCRLIGHCHQCRTDLKRRADMGTPDLCPHGFTIDALPVAKRGLGDLIEAIAKPIARALSLDCLEKDGTLKPKSKCAERRDALNKLTS